MWERGIIVTDAGEVIAKPRVILDELNQTNVGREARIEPTGPGYHRIGFGPMTISGYGDVYAAAYYHVGLLEKIFLNLGTQPLPAEAGRFQRVS